MALSIVGPPMPRVKDQNVGGEPCRAGLDGVELEHAADGLAHYVHQVGGVVQHYRHSVLLRKIKAPLIS